MDSDYHLPCARICGNLPAAGEYFARAYRSGCCRVDGDFADEPGAAVSCSAGAPVRAVAMSQATRLLDYARNAGSCAIGLPVLLWVKVSNPDGVSC